MNTPRLSITIPSYNHAAYIGEAIEGILGQTLTDFELIIVDDGSTDNSWEIISSYAKRDSRIIALRQENQGPSAAVNHALSQVKGDFIAAHTSDDRSVKNRLEKQVAFLDGHPDCDAVGSFIEEIDNKGQTVAIGHYAAWFNVEIDINDPKSWVWQNRLAAPTLMFRRAFFERYGTYTSDLIYTQDWEMWIRALSMGGKLHILREKLLQYRGHDDNLTHKNHRQIFWEYAYISSKTLHPWLMAIGNESLLVENIVGFWRHEFFPQLDQKEKIALVRALLYNLKCTFREFFPAQYDEEAITRIAPILIEKICQHQGQLAGLDHRINRLSEIIIERDEQINRLATQLAEANAAAERLHHQYSEILRSKSWRLTKPLRALARLLSYRSLMSIDRSIVLSRAKAIAHTFPVPRWVKTRLRSFLLASGNPQFRDDEKLLSGRPMRPECCALTPGQVSVILPVYNQASMLEESIESVLRQTYEHLELIVLNDGSSDNVERVLEKYVGHPKVRIYSQVNQKLPRALSNAFELAQGEYWTWTSADNLMEPQQLDRLVSRLRREPMLGMVYADYYAIDDRGQLLRDPLWRRHNRPDPPSGEIRLPRTTHSLNTQQDNFIGPCFLYRGWIGRILGEYDSLQGVEDYDYWMRINSLFSVKHLGTNELLYRYRVHDNTLNARALEEKIGEKVQKLMRYEKKRADFYRKPLEFYADPISLEWLEEAGIPRSQIRPIVSLSSRTSDQPRVIVCSADSLNKFSQSVYEYQSIPVVILFNKPKPMPYDLAPFLRRSGVIAAVRDQRTASRVRIVQPIPVVDADAKEISKAISAFARNWLFYTSTRDTTKLVCSSPHPFSCKPSQRNVLLQVDNFVQGGMENVIMDLAYTLAKEGIDSRILVLGRAGEAMVRARERGLKVDVYDGRLDQREYKNYLISHHVRLINSHYSVFGSEAAHEIGIPLVQTIHNSYVWMDGNMLSRYRASDKHTAKYVCVSLTAAKYSDAILGLDASKMVVIPNGIDTSVFSCFDPRRERERLRRRWGFGENDSIFLNVASIHATKAQLPLVRAFAIHVEKHSHSRLVLLGSVMDEAYNQQIKEFVKRSGLEQQVIFAGYDKEVGPYYYAADVFVLPSFWEGWSLSFGEALYTGMPIVATNVGAAGEFTHMSNVLLIEPPFGDITNLNYLNLEKYIQSEDKEFEARLARVMGDSLKHKRISPNVELRNQLDRSHAYQSYLSLVKTI